MSIFWKYKTKSTKSKSKPKPKPKSKKKTVEIDVEDLEAMDELVELVSFIADIFKE